MSEMVREIGKEEVKTEETVEAVEEVVGEVVQKPYTFRRLNSTDVFPMFKIISLIGVNEFTSCFEKDAIKNLVNSLIKSMTKKDVEEQDKEKESESIKNIVGITLTMDIVNIVLSNLPKCESYIYQLLAQTSDLSEDEIKKLDFAVFFEMVIDFVKKEEFKDFIKVVSKLFK